LAGRLRRLTAKELQEPADANVKTGKVGIRCLAERDKMKW
jgi:hypothetical protein